MDPMKDESKSDVYIRLVVKHARVTHTFRERVPAPGTCISGGSTRTDLPARVPALAADLPAEPWFAPGERLPTITR